MEFWGCSGKKMTKSVTYLVSTNPTNRIYRRHFNKILLDCLHHFSLMLECTCCRSISLAQNSRRINYIPRYFQYLPWGIFTFHRIYKISKRHRHPTLMRTQMKQDNNRNSNLLPACETVVRLPPTTLASRPLAPQELAVQLTSQMQATFIASHHTHSMQPCCWCQNQFAGLLSSLLLSFFV